MKPLNILVACEESQAVTIEMRKRGHNAYSCDILPCSGGHPEFHMKMDVFEAYYSRVWDMVMSFQPCTDLALSGARWFREKRESGQQEKSIRFFFEVWKISNCSENPMGVMNGGKYIKKWFPELYTEMKAAGFPFKPTQIIHPYYFGDDAQKTTCLWLRGLPPLTHRSHDDLFGKKTHVGKGEFVTFRSGKRMPKWYADAPSTNNPENAKLRSKTFPGIAQAMAEQWTPNLNQ